MITEQQIQYLGERRPWYVNDIDMSLKFLNDNPDKKAAFLDYVKRWFANSGDYCSDSWAIEMCVKQGTAEAFRHFDSDVCETYIKRFLDYFIDTDDMNETYELRNKRKRDEAAKDIMQKPAKDWSDEEFEFMLNWGYADSDDFAELELDTDGVDYHVDDLGVDDYIK